MYLVIRLVILNFVIIGYPTKIQSIKGEASGQWCINFPSAVAQAMEFEKGEVVEWVIEKKKKMVLKRPNSIELETKKTLQRNLIDELDDLINECHGAFSNHDSWKLLRELMYGS